jgi:hypothetical protein
VSKSRSLQQDAIGAAHPLRRVTTQRPAAAAITENGKALCAFQATLATDPTLTERLAALIPHSSVNLVIEHGGNRLGHPAPAYRRAAAVSTLTRRRLRCAPPNQARAAGLSLSNGLELRLGR